MGTYLYFPFHILPITLSNRHFPLKLTFSYFLYGSEISFEGRMEGEGYHSFSPELSTWHLSAPPNFCISCTQFFFLFLMKLLGTGPWQGIGGLANVCWALLPFLTSFSFFSFGNTITRD